MSYSNVGCLKTHSQSLKKGFGKTFICLFRSRHAFYAITLITRNSFSVNNNMNEINYFVTAGGIAGVVISCVVFVAIVTVIIVICRRRRTVIVVSTG